MAKKKKQREQPVAPTAETSGKKIEFTPGAWRFYTAQSEAVRTAFNAALSRLEKDGRLAPPQGKAHPRGGAEMRGKIDKSKVVMGAWATAKAQQAERLERDPKARAAWERRMARDAERGVRADAKMYAREHGKRLDALRRDCPGFAENENADRTATALKAAMLDARDRSGLTQAEIAARMGAEPSNVSRLLHGAGGVNGATFAAFLRACGFGFKVDLFPLDGASAMA